MVSEGRAALLPAPAGGDDGAAAWQVHGVAPPLLADEAGSRHPASPPSRVYGSRFYVLAMYCAFSFLQSMCWSLMGPITDQAAIAYSISSDEIQLMLNWGPILFLATSLVFTYFLDRPGGLRGTVVVSNLLITAGSLVRIFATDASTRSRYLLHASFVLNALGGPISMAAVGRLSEDWFPLAERATATAMAAEANIMGSLGSYLLGPYIVVDNSIPQIVTVFYVCLGLTAVVCIGTIAYFPSTPPTPPTVSAAHQREAEKGVTVRYVLRSIVSLFTNYSFVLLFLGYGLSAGMASGFGGMLELDLQVLNITPQQAGWVGFAGTLAGNVAGVVLGFAVDHTWNTKRILVSVLVASALCYSAFTLYVQQVFPASWYVGNTPFVTTLLLAMVGDMFLNASVPMFFELAMESAYPVLEGQVITHMTNACNLGAFILLFVPLDTARTAFNWLFTGCIFACGVGLALLFTQEGRRRAVDLGKGAVSGEGGEGVTDEFVFGIGRVTSHGSKGKRRRRRPRGTPGLLEGESDAGSTLPEDGTRSVWSDATGSAVSGVGDAVVSPLRTMVGGPLVVAVGSAVRTPPPTGSLNTIATGR